MKKIILTLFLLIGSTLLIASENEKHIFDIGLVGPKYQVHSEKSDISGLRLGLINVEHRNVTGLDITGIASKITGDFKGLQLGAWYNVVEGEAKGVQLGGANLNGRMTGLQLGALNFNDESNGLEVGLLNKDVSSSGLQLGLINYSENHSGVMIGLYNHAKIMNGLQLGLINYVGNNEYMKVVPFLNFNFGL